jgi:hypothetical protein
MGNVGRMVRKRSAMKRRRLQLSNKASLLQVQKIIPGHGWLLHRPVTECNLLVRCSEGT